MSEWNSNKLFIPPRAKKKQPEVKKEEPASRENHAAKVEQPSTSESSNSNTAEQPATSENTGRVEQPTTSESSNTIKAEQPAANGISNVKLEALPSESIPIKTEKTNTAQAGPSNTVNTDQQQNNVKTEKAEPSVNASQAKDKGKQPEKVVVLHEVKPEPTRESLKSNEEITSSKHFHDMFTQVIKLALNPKLIADQLKNGKPDQEQIQRISRAALDVVTTVLQHGPQAAQIEQQIPNFQAAAETARSNPSPNAKKMTIAEAIQAFINVLPKPATAKPTPKGANNLKESIDNLQESLGRLNIPSNTPPVSTPPVNATPPAANTPPTNGNNVRPNGYPTPPNGQPQYAYPPPPNGYVPSPNGYVPPPHGYPPSPHGYPPPPQVYPPPPNGFVPPPNGFAPPPNGYRPPPNGYPPPPNGYHPMPTPNQAPPNQAPPPTAASTASASKQAKKKRKTTPSRPPYVPIQATFLPPQTPSTIRPQNQQPLYPAQPVQPVNQRPVYNQPTAGPSQAATTAKQTAKRPVHNPPRPPPPMPGSFPTPPAANTARRPPPPMPGSFPTPPAANTARRPPFNTATRPPQPTPNNNARPPPASSSTAARPAFNTSNRPPQTSSCTTPQASTSAGPTSGPTFATSAAYRDDAQWLAEANRYFVGAKKERVKRAIQQKIYILSRQLDPHNDSVEKFEVIGSIGNTYTVTMGITISCSCPDYQDRYTHCKHILTIMIKVYRLPFSDNMYHTLSTTKNARINARSTGHRVDPSVLLPPHIRRKIAGVRQGSTQPEPQVERKPLDAANCPVCYERFNKERVVDIIYCQTCGNNVHGACFKRASQARTGDAVCLYCQTKWVYQNALPSGSRPALDEAHMYEGRPNFAKELGISRERDTSTYRNNDFWTGRYKKRSYWYSRYEEGSDVDDYDSEHDDIYDYF